MAGVEWRGMTTWVARVVDMQKITPEKTQAKMENIGERGLEVMDANTPVRSGKLKEGNTLTSIAGGFSLSNATPYAQFVNYGTRYMAAQPFLDPAVEAVSQMMDEELPSVFDDM